tara:strand:- start:414 stop:629 length:216 start_codon:yes stop_codon:yes gene_type:complete
MKAQFTDEDKPVNVIISWSYDLTGEHKDLREDPITYFFDTNTEADAFLHGVSQAVEWFSYHVISRQNTKPR